MTLAIEVFPEYSPPVTAILAKSDELIAQRTEVEPINSVVGPLFLSKYCNFNLYKDYCCV